MCIIISNKDVFRKILCMFLFALTICYATKYAGEFQELIVGGRICGMGGTGVAQGIDPTAIVLNPANAPLISRSLHLMHAENFSGIVRNEFGALVVPKANSAYGVGLQVISVGNIKLTTLPDTSQDPGDENQPIPFDTVSTQDMILYLNAAQTKNLFAYGANLKVYYRNLAVMTGIGGGVDIGLRLNLANLNAGIAMRDFILAPVYWNNDTKENISPKISFGVAPSIPLNKINTLLTIESDIVKDLSFNEFKLNTGIEIAYRNTIYGRLGKSGAWYTAGAGLRYKKFIFDYGLITHPDLGISNKFSAGLDF
ncbi:MAG: hypothetical protein ABIL22_03415 [candidate division WOR-3 bacterium]